MLGREGWQVSRRSFLLGGCVCFLGLGESGDAGGHRDHHTFTPSQRSDCDPRALSSVETDRRVIALTFDDGPDPQFTPAVLDVLAACNVTATFFAVGRNVRAHPGLYRAVVAAGHAIANHTQDHLCLDGHPRGVIDQQITMADASMRAAGHRPGPFFRPPHGWTSPQVAAATRMLGLRSVFWSDCLEAHLKAGIDGAADTVIHHAEPGSIVLCHDGGRLAGPHPQHEDRSRTVAALPRLVDGILDKGLMPVTVADLVRAPS